MVQKQKSFDWSYSKLKNWKLKRKENSRRIGVKKSEKSWKKRQEIEKKIGEVE